MALDWCILNENGTPDVVVPMGQNAHRELLDRAAGLPLLWRAADYYADADYAPSEVSALLAELASVGVPAELAALCREAFGRKCGISVVAD